MTLPLPLRNRLADLIVESLHDPQAREGLVALAAVCADPGALGGVADPPGAFPADLFEPGQGGWRLKSGWRQHAAELGERAERARRAVAARALDPADPPLATALSQAALLFEARLYFEAHELLEPYWMRGEGGLREALQGLIQVAVGFQHLANGNVSGARALLHDGSARLLSGRLEGLDLASFGRGVVRCLDQVLAQGAEAPRDFDWSGVPPFPAPEGV